MERCNPGSKEYQGKTQPVLIGTLSILAHEEPYGEGNGANVSGDGYGPPRHAQLQKRHADNPIQLCKQDIHLDRIQRHIPCIFELADIPGDLAKDLAPV